MFCQRLVASAEGPFTTVCKIYTFPQTAESQQSVQTLVQKTPPLSEFLVSYWPIPNRNLTLTSRVILLTVVSSLLTEARLYEFSRHLEYYLWYTPANSPINLWNRLNPTFTMPDISFGTLHLLLEPRFHPTPRFDLWVGQFIKSSISFGISKMPVSQRIWPPQSKSASGYGPPPRIWPPQQNWMKTSSLTF